MKKDIFISYRRKGGEHLALLMFHQLQQDGYSVFLDVETLHSGKYNEALFSRIEESTDVILILSPHALDNCQAPDDWVRKEIESALKHNKNIIPIMMEGFTDWPSDLPSTMRELPNFNGLANKTGYFTAMMQKLERDFLYSKPVRTPVLSGVTTDAEPARFRKCIACGSLEVTVDDPLPKDVLHLRVFRKMIAWWTYLTAVVCIIMALVTAIQEKRLTLFGINPDFLWQLPLIRMIDFRPETYLHFLIVTACLLLMGHIAYKYSNTRPILELENERRTVTVTCKKCSAKHRVSVAAENLTDPEIAAKNKAVSTLAVPFFLALPVIYFSSLDVVWKEQLIESPEDFFTTVIVLLMLPAAYLLHRIDKIIRHLSGIPTGTFREYLQSDITGEPYQEEDPAQPDEKDLSLKEKVIRFAKPDHPINNKKEDE